MPLKEHATSTVPEKKKSGIGKYIGCGCLTIVVVLSLAIGIFAYYLYKQATGLLDQYTGTEPVALQKVEASEQEVAKVLDRTKAFSLDSTNKDHASLDLTARDINIFLNNNPGSQKFGEFVYITIIDNNIGGEISLPLGQFSSMLEGRYLNGTALFDVQLNNGILSVFLKDITIAGVTIPEEIMSKIQSENLAAEFNTDPEGKETLEKFESIHIENNTLIITPKQ